MNMFDSASLTVVGSESAVSQASGGMRAPLVGTITSLESLREHLQWAIELEHSTIPPYLCALYSIEPGRNLEAVEVITSVVVEEMLHLMLAANLLNAVGGRPRLDIPQMLPGYPRPLPHSDRSFEISLFRFGPDAIETFLKIEQPSPTSGPPEGDSYETIGQFYESIKQGVRNLSATLGEASVFCGDPTRQVTDEHIYGGGGHIIAVNNLDSALAALEEVVEQGEGANHAGKKIISPELSGEVASHAADDSLTPAEISVLRLIADGNANKQIAAQLSISEETVKSRVKNILSKLGANDRTQAVTIALKRGIIELQSL